MKRKTENPACGNKKPDIPRELNITTDCYPARDAQ